MNQKLTFDHFKKINIHKRSFRLISVICLILLFNYKQCVQASMQEIPPNYVDPDGETFT